MIKHIDSNGILSTDFGESGDIESEIPRFLARIEAEFAKNMERAREIWNDIIMKRNNNFKNVSLWLEFINLERSDPSSFLMILT